MSFPTQIYVGDSFEYEFAEDQTDYPSATWTYYLAFRGPFTATLTGSVDSGTVTFSATGATTSAYEKGRATYTIYANNGDDRHIFDIGYTEFLANPLAHVDGESVSTHAMKVLDAIEAVIENRATKDQSSMTVGGQSLVLMSVTELFILRDVYKRRVGQETRQGKPPRHVLTRFTS